MTKRTCILIPALLLLTFGVLSAGTPGYMSYQGRLTDNGGNPLTGVYDLTFRIYNDSIAGSIVYEETHSNVAVTDGLFSVLIGGKSFILPFDNNIFVGRDCFLGIQVDADPEIAPRTRLATSPYAFRVATVDSADGGTVVGALKVAGNASTTGNVGVGTDTPVAGAGPAVARVLQIDAPSTGGSTSGAALTLTDGGIGNTWDMVATSFTGVYGIFGNGNGLLYIEPNGDVGLGTASPSTGAVNRASRVLEINAPMNTAVNSGAALTLVDGNLGYAWDIIATSSSGNNLGIFANGTGRLYLEPDGDLGLGSTTPSTGAVNVASRVLEISAPFVAANNSGAALTLTDGSFGSAWDIVATSQTGGFAIYGNNNQAIFIKPTGEVGIGTSSPSTDLHVAGNICYTGTIGACSDERFKTDVHGLSNALDKVMQLRGVSYLWKQAEYPDRKFDDRRQIGFIAQEIELLFPEMVMTDADGFKSVDYGRLTPVLVEAIREQQKQIDELNGLRGELARLQSLVEKLASQSGAGTDSEYGAK
ncbi:MAG: tail fiber domain-containing protein [candidate division Zixibacteria bacterium]|nr:tail fiber domain-containing protein [candidate division Zixibacteria bacterium]